MHDEILTEAQIHLLPLVRDFSNRFGLVGGTAIALQLGHRRSVDFDLFTFVPFENGFIRRLILKRAEIDEVVWDEKGQYTLILDGVRFTFFHYPFSVTFCRRFQNIIKMPDLTTLAAMKAYALGRRAKWKDYIDLYFIIKETGFKPLITRAKTIFSKEFNEKLFRSQLAYFKDIDRSEEVIYLPGFACDDSSIRKSLAEISLEH